MKKKKEQDKMGKKKTPTKETPEKTLPKVSKVGEFDLKKLKIPRDSWPNGKPKGLKNYTIYNDQGAVVHVELHNCVYRIVKANGGVEPCKGNKNFCFKKGSAESAWKRLVEVVDGW